MHPGQLVVCIGADALFYKLMLWRIDLCPRRGLVYTVGSVTANCPQCGEDHVTVEEIENVFASGYPARWFRPCRETNFEKFMQRLLPVNEQRIEG